MNVPLMPKATALWLIENTTLTFEQIAEFCGLHLLEVQAIADGEASVSAFGFDPITNGQVSKEDIERCSKDPSARLTLIVHPEAKQKKKGARYTPMARRQDRPDAIAWLLKHCPELSVAQIVSLIGTTKATIQAVQERSHWNAPNIKPRNPVTLGLCTQKDLDLALDRAHRAGRVNSPPEADSSL